MGVGNIYVKGEIKDGEADTCRANTDTERDIGCQKTLSYGERSGKIQGCRRRDEM